MLPRLKNKTFFPSWVDDFLDNPLLPNFENRAGATMPSVNINEDPNQFNIEVAAPGMEKKDFKIDLNNKMLTVSSEHEEKSEEKDTCVKCSAIPLSAVHLHCLIW